MANVGSLAFKIVADATTFSSGLDQAVKKAEKFGRAVSGAATSPIAEIAKAASIPGAVVTGILTPIRDLLSSIPLVGSAFAAIPVTGAGFMTFLKEGMDKVRQTAFLADKLGVSTEFMSALQLQAGENIDVVVHSLGHLEKELGAATAGSVEAQGKFDRLGLNWKELGSIGFDKAVGLVYDRLREIPDAAQRAYAGQSLMSRGFVEMIPYIMKGSEGLARMGQMAEEAGISISRIQAQEVIEAARSMKQIGHAIEGIQIQLAVQLAPYIKAAADEFKALKGHGVDAGATVAESISGAALAVALLADGLHAVVSFAKSVQFAGEGISATFTAAIAVVAHGLSYLPGAVGETFGEVAKSLDDATQESLKKMDQLAQELEDRRNEKSATSKVGDFTAGIRNRAQQNAANALKGGGGPGLSDETQAKIVAIQNSLDESAATWGMSSRAVEIYKVAQQGATAATVAHMQAKAAELDQLDRIASASLAGLNIYDQYTQRVQMLDGAMAAGKITAEEHANAIAKFQTDLEKSSASAAWQVFADNQTPLEKFTSKMDELHQLLGSGQVSWALYTRAADKTFEDLAKTSGIGERKSPAGVEFGSKEYFSQIAKFENQASDDPQKRMEETLKQLREMDVQKLALQRRMAEALEGRAQVLDNLDY